jgi:hypothetical protein
MGLKFRHVVVAAIPAGLTLMFLAWAGAPSWAGLMTFLILWLVGVCFCTFEDALAQIPADYLSRLESQLDDIKGQLSDIADAVGEIRKNTGPEDVTGKL